MIVSQALARARTALAAASDSPRTDAHILLAHILERQRAWLVAHDDDSMTPVQAERFDGLCELRAHGMPIAYITGSAWFYGRRFAVGPEVLIPRPESEHLVDAAVAFLRARRAANPRVLDVGGGSGAIACSIAAEVPNAGVDATDVSQSARAMAERNALELGVAGRVRTYFGNVADPVAHRRYDVVVANLPYVPSQDLPRPPAAAGFEPRCALDGGADGLDAYRQLLPQLPRLVAPGGIALLEAAPPTIRRLAELTRAHWPGAAVEIRADYGGRERYLRCNLAPSEAG